MYPDTTWAETSGGFGWTISNNVRYGTGAEAGLSAPDDGDFLLVSDSPAIDQGVDLSGYGIVDDMRNQSRPLGAAYDLGALECY